MPKALDAKLLKSLSKQYGDSFYILDSDVFEKNCRKLLAAFKAYYPKTNIAYSYKTNYVPKLVKMVDRVGGLAEVVSEMEMEVALRSGIAPSHIIWNGPVKNVNKVKELLLLGGTVNIDSIYEVGNILDIAKKYPDYKLNVGLRLNYDVGDGAFSRFGLDVESIEFDKAIRALLCADNIQIVNLQSHFATRLSKYWDNRAKGMIKVYKNLVKQYNIKIERLDLGGGIYGEIPDELIEQLNVGKHTFDHYASKAAKTFQEEFGDDGPLLFLEPGTAVASNCMRYVVRVQTIKNIRGKAIATTNGSQKNISMSALNPPMEVIAAGEGESGGQYRDMDIAGYTCIESDYLYRGYNGQIAVGDYIVFGCCGSYSIVMKPPFIFPNVPVIDINGLEVEVIKRAETFDDLFQTFHF